MDEKKNKPLVVENPRDPIIAKAKEDGLPAINLHELIARGLRAPTDLWIGTRGEAVEFNNRKQKP